MHQNIKNRISNELDDRNNAIWTISDTILQVKGADEKKQYEILCNNLKIICNAELSLLATYDKSRKRFIIHAISSDKTKDKQLFENLLSKNIQIIEDITKSKNKEIEQLCKKLVNALEVDIEATSKYGKGTTIRIHIPYKPVKDL